MKIYRNIEEDNRKSIRDSENDSIMQRSYIDIMPLLTGVNWYEYSILAVLLNMSLAAECFELYL